MISTAPATDQPSAFVVVLVPDRSMTDDEATRALRAFLKAAWRGYRLRCTSAERTDADPKAAK